MMVWEVFLDTLVDPWIAVHSAGVVVDRVRPLMTAGLHPLMGPSCRKRTVSQESHRLKPDPDHDGELYEFSSVLLWLQVHQETFGCGGRTGTVHKS